MTTVSWYQRWLVLNDWLDRHRALWQVSPFRVPEPDWLARWPAALDWLDGLSDARVEYYQERMTELAGELARFWPGLDERRELIRLPRLRGPESTLPERRALDMPERKRLQAGAFTAALRPLPEPALDWCCGKGHLARTLAAHGCPRVRGWELQGPLVDDGNRLAQRAGLPVLVERRDVMAASFDPGDAGHAVALHACGDLHRRLLRAGVEQRLPRLSLSPCCYHLTAADPHAPLSARARAHADLLEPTRDQLRLAVQESVTAPARIRREQQRMRAWRLGFDGLQRQLRGSDDYLTVPPHPSSLARGDFEGFCRWAAAQRGLALPAGIDFDHWANDGHRRLARVRRLELLRHLFRRPLELWLVLDLVLFLEEAGYRVRLGRFCRRALTPRNLLIDAHR